MGKIEEISVFPIFLTDFVIDLNQFCLPLQQIKQTTIK
jgi:hypothetical protein